MSGALDAVLEVTERLLERGLVLVLQVRRTADGRRLTLGVGLLDRADSVLIAAAAGRLLRRRRTTSEDVERRRSSFDP